MAFYDPLNCSSISSGDRFPERNEIPPGCLLWLPVDAYERDSKIYQISGLEYGALDHPVLIIGSLGLEKADYYMVLVCTGTFHPERGDLPISEAATTDKCKHKDSDNVPVLQYDDDTGMQPIHTHVNTRTVYLVSPKMIRAQRNVESREDNDLPVQHPKIDYFSLQIVLNRGADAIKQFKERTGVRAILEKHPMDMPTVFPLDPPSLPPSPSPPPKTLATKEIASTRAQSVIANDRQAELNKSALVKAATDKGKKVTEPVLICTSTKKTTPGMHESHSSGAVLPTSEKRVGIKADSTRVIPKSETAEESNNVSRQTWLAGEQLRTEIMVSLRRTLRRIRML